MSRRITYFPHRIFLAWERSWRPAPFKRLTSLAPSEVGYTKKINTPIEYPVCQQHIPEFETPAKAVTCERSAVYWSLAAQRAKIAPSAGVHASLRREPKQGDQGGRTQRTINDEKYLGTKQQSQKVQGQQMKLATLVRVQTH